MVEVEKKKITRSRRNPLISFVTVSEGTATSKRRPQVLRDTSRRRLLTLWPSKISVCNNLNSKSSLTGRGSGGRKDGKEKKRKKREGHSFSTAKTSRRRRFSKLRFRIRSRYLITPKATPFSFISRIKTRSSQPSCKAKIRARCEREEEEEEEEEEEDIQLRLSKTSSSRRRRGREKWFFRSLDDAPFFLNLL